MYKKSLLFGAAARSIAVVIASLLVLFAFVGCSNPSSGSTEYVFQASSDYPYPPETVTANNWDSLIGLLNDYNADTNLVQHIRYQGVSATIDDDLIIPAGKIVYLAEDYDTAGDVDYNITVREGARLVLVGDFLAGAGTHPVTSLTSGYLLVRGTVEVFRGLTVAADARTVSDYTVENIVEPGRNTVIGTHVTVLPGAVLTLDITDLIPPTESLPNKFTPQQAWAAAGQGHLVIGTGSTPRTPSSAAANTLTAYYFTVRELLTGVSPNASRSYTVTSGRFSSEELPPVIPQGAYILTSAIPTNSAGGTLTVNGWLSTNGTLNGITKIEVGNSGSLILTEPSGELLTGLTDLRIGPSALLDITSNDVSLKTLTALFLGDGSSINVPGNNVTFMLDTPLALTIGKNVTYAVGMSASAKVDTVVAKDASLVGSSTLTVYPGSTFTVNDGVTFTVGSGSTFDISRQPIPPTGDTPPITINGAIELAAGGAFVGPAFATVQADPASLFKTIGLGPNGKVVLNYGAEFSLGGTDLFVGNSSATYTWDGTAGADTAGAQIEINDKGLIIRDINEISSAVEVTVAAPGAGILSNHSLFLDRAVTLDIAATYAIYLTGAAGGGAKLKGPGKVTADTLEIIGGDEGWQAVSENNSSIAIFAGTLMPVNPDGAVTAAATLKALGLGADINTSALEIQENTTVDLGGSVLRKAGKIALASGGTITFADDTSVILTGIPVPATRNLVALSTTSGGTDVTAGAFTEIGILDLTGDGDVKAETTAVADASPANTGPAGRLIALAGDGGTSNTVATATSAVSISSETITEADSTL
jgi:hypothetical protein